MAVLSAAVIAGPALADGYAFPINLPDGPLVSSLQNLARQSGTEVLFDPRLLTERRAPTIRGHLTVDAALQRLLGGSGFMARRSASGAWIIEPLPLPGAPAPEDFAVPEILVIGRRSHDADIRRRENDVQPYQVSSGAQVVRAHRDNLDQYFQSRVTANTTTAPPSLQAVGKTNSLIDLRGLGSSQTLILVDGRRMPGTADGSLETGQPDINAIPLHLIERIETLTGTAGGIYGLGALGGVVNVVLRRDLRGLELHGTAGVSSRGDARRLALEGGLGLTPDDGRTELMIYASRTWQQRLTYGARGLPQRGQELVNKFAPATFADAPPTIDGVVVFSSAGGDLVFKPEYGGGSLGSNRSFVPPGFAGTSADLASALRQNVGQLKLGYTSDERKGDLASTPHTLSLTANLRHRFGGGVEAYLDALILRDSGSFRSAESTAVIALAADSPANPFTSAISAKFPGPPLPAYSKARFASDRYTAGIIIPLPHGWRANADATFGSSGYRGGYLAPRLDSLDFTGVNCPVDPFGSTEAVERGLLACAHAYRDADRAHSRFSEQSLRLAGPLFRTAAGPATLTASLQNRREALAGQTYFITDDVYFPSGISDGYLGGTSNTRSVYGELDAPLTAEDAQIPLLKGLTVQLALRYDHREVAFTGYDDPADAAVHPRFAGLMYTAGAKFRPLPWLLLRGSYATGRQPPSLGYLSDNYLALGTSELIDPKRGNVPLEDDSYYNLIYGGIDLKQVRARTIALGLVLNPDGDRGPRLSLDYSHTRRTGDLSAQVGGYVVANEDHFPGRVTRAPLTDADRAKGYTAGVVTEVDARGLTVGHLVSDSIDARLDWRIPFAGGLLQTYGGATLQMRNRRSGPFQPSFDYIGFHGSPVRWRANGGAEWTRGRTMIGANLQYLSRYRVVGAEYTAFADVTEVPQGSKYVSAQAYLDLTMERRFPVHWGGQDREVGLDLGIVNLFDHAPPYDFPNYGPRYSLYGDPRQRRLELTLNAGF